MNNMLEKDLLYQTRDNELASIRVVVKKPDAEGRLQIVITPRTEHSVEDNFESIKNTIQEDIFNRIEIDINNNAVFYVLNDNDITPKLIR